MSEIQETSLGCPKCPGKLKEMEVEGVRIDFCWICEGIWFDSGELEKVIQNDTRNLKLDHLGRDDFDGEEFADVKANINETAGCCPRCADGTELKREPYEPNPKLGIDVCPKGHGLWLDGGEVHLLRDRTLANVLHVWDHFVSWAQLKLAGKIK